MRSGIDRLVVVIVVMLAGGVDLRLHVAIAARAEERGIAVVFEPLDQQSPPGNAGLFVGVNEFEDPTLSPLQFAVHDAIELAHLFVGELKLIPASHAYLLLSGEPQAAAMRERLEDLRRQGVTVRTATRAEILAALLQVCGTGRSDSDLLVAFFSSHGFEQAGSPLIMPRDGRRKLLADTAVPLRSIETQMEESRAGHRLVLVDACQERVPARAIDRAAGTPMARAFSEALKTPTGQAKLASCSPGELSFEHPMFGGVGHGVFTYAILEALRGGAPADCENLVRFGAVSGFVSHRVTEWSNERGRKQTPWLSGPEKIRQLPLAVRADDLTSLAEAVLGLEATSLFDASLRRRLAAQSRAADLSRDADRLLVSRTRDFVQGRLSEDLFVPYLLNVLGPPLAVAPFDAAAARAYQEAWADRLGRPVDLTNSVGIPLRLIPPGEFLMGSPDSEQDRDADETPQRPVLIAQPFYIGQYEVTVGQFRQFVQATGYRTDAEKDGRGSVGWNSGRRELEGPRPEYTWQHPGFEQSDGHPAVNLSWNDAAAFCEWLSDKESRVYRLPTEAQWEYACRAGTTTRWYHGNSADGLAGISNVADGTAKQTFPGWDTIAAHDGHVFTAPGGSYGANPWGLYDVHGNASEWCRDWYAVDSYVNSPGTDPQGPDSGQFRVVRGGSWYAAAWGCRSAIRNYNAPAGREPYLGFRVTLVLCP
jgi:formylglycine-generating enzyme